MHGYSMQNKAEALPTKAAPTCVSPSRGAARKSGKQQGAEE